MSQERVKMPRQRVEERIRNFDEVSLGYTDLMAQEEAKRCLNCKNPQCVLGCPVNNNIPKFINQIVNGDFEGAYETLSLTNNLPAMSGRVCPQELQCEGKCIRGIKGQSVAIGNLERYVADKHFLRTTNSQSEAKPNGAKVAIVGSGPSGLTAAADLAKMGYRVTIFEREKSCGGILRYGIPNFCLPNSTIDIEVEKLESLGVKIVNDVSLGKDITIGQMFDDGFKAVFVGVGANESKMMGIDGENLEGVYSANEYLFRVNTQDKPEREFDKPLFAGKHAIVVGGGNVAMDVARTALRKGSRVTIVYRRSVEELPCRSEELNNTQEEGIRLCLLTNPVKILGEKGKVSGVECVKMKLGEPDASGRRRPEVIENSNFVIECDSVIMAIGAGVDSGISLVARGVATDKWGQILVNDNYATNVPGVFSAGDVVTGPKTVIAAMGAGKRAAISIDEYIKSLK